MDLLLDLFYKLIFIWLSVDLFAILIGGFTVAVIRPLYPEWWEKQIAREISTSVLII